MLSGGFTHAAAGWPVLADFGLANWVYICIYMYICIYIYMHTVLADFGLANWVYICI